MHDVWPHLEITWTHAAEVVVADVVGAEDLPDSVVQRTHPD